jgi:hypothetical protein
MFERILFRRSDLSRHRNGPYAKERERYLTLLMEEGRAQPTLRQIANLLYHMAEQLPLSLPSVTPSQIEAAARQWSTALVRCHSSRAPHGNKVCISRDKLAAHAGTFTEAGVSTSVHH